MQRLAEHKQKDVKLASSALMIRAANLVRGRVVTEPEDRHLGFQFVK